MEEATKRLKTDSLVNFYFERISSDYDGNAGARAKLAKFIRGKLDEGMSSKEIMRNLYDKAEQIQEYIAVCETEDKPVVKDNLIEEGVYYLHSQLREPLPPIRCEQDEDGNTIWHNMDIDTTPKMKTVFTLDNLLQYYYKKLNIPVYLRREAKHKGALKHMVNIHGLDVFMFMIDSAAGAAEDDDIIPDSPFFIDDYAVEGKNRYDFKLQLLKEAGEKVGLDN